MKNQGEGEELQSLTDARKYLIETHMSEKLLACITSINSFKKQTSSEIEALLEENEGLQRQLKDYIFTKELNKNYEMTFRGLFEKIKDFRKSNIDLDETKKSLEVELNDCKKRNQEITAKAEKDKVKIGECEKWIEKIEHQLNVTVSNLIEAKKSLDTSKEEIKDLTDERNRLEAAHETLKQENENCKNENQAKKAQFDFVIRGLSEVIENLKKINFNLVKKNSNLECKVGSLELVEAQLQMERIERHMSVEKVDKLEKELEDKRAEAEKVKIRNHQLLKVGLSLKTRLTQLSTAPVNTRGLKRRLGDPIDEGKNKSTRVSVFERLNY